MYLEGAETAGKSTLELVHTNIAKTKTLLSS